MKKLKIGFLIDELKVSSYVYDLIDYVDKSNYFFKPILIHGHYVKKSKYEKIRFLLKSGFSKSIKRLLIIFLTKVIKKLEINLTLKRHPNFLKTIDLNKDGNFKSVLVKGKWSTSELYLNFTETDIHLLEVEKLDCVIRCGSGIIIGDFLNVAKYGVLSFHHGDNRVNRGGPSGFWEVFLSQPSSGFIIQKLNSELDGGDVLFRGNLMTSWNWTLNNAQLLEKSNFFLKKILEKIAKKGALPQVEGPRLHGELLLKLNSSKILLSYIFQVLGPAIFGKIVNKYYKGNALEWSVAYGSFLNCVGRS